MKIAAPAEELFAAASGQPNILTEVKATKIAQQIAAALLIIVPPAPNERQVEIWQSEATTITAISLALRNVWRSRRKRSKSISEYHVFALDHSTGRSAPAKFLGL